MKQSLQAIAVLASSCLQPAYAIEHSLPSTPHALERDTPSYIAELDSNWRTSLSIGTPPQTFQVLPDTGAPSLAMSSVFLVGNTTKSPYNPNNSSTAKQLPGYTYSNCYGSGHCGSGNVYQDIVTVGGISNSLAFEVATHNNGVGQGDNADGDFGLAYSKAGMTTSPKKVPTWFQSIMQQLDQKVFAFDYDWDNMTGQLQFGFFNTTYKLGYAPVLADYFWAVNFTGYVIGNQSIARTWTVVVDSGTGVSGVPENVAEDYFKTVPGSNKTQAGYTYPCGSDLPSFDYTVGSFQGTIPGRYLEGKEINNKCMSNLQTSNDTVIFGQNFIAASYVLFDYENARVGFANRVATTGNGTTTTTTTTPAQASPTSAGRATYVVRMKWLMIAGALIVWCCH